MKEGDRNTKYIHKTSLKHRMANRISRLNTDEGLTDNEEIIKREVVEFFGRLLQYDPDLNLDKQNMFLKCISSCISAAHNLSLTSIPSLNEISKAVFSFAGDTTPSLDGFPLLFFHKY